MGMNRPFWNGKKVLLTGHTGFKGSWLSLWLQKMGVDLVGYALPPSTTLSLFKVARISDGMTSILGDIRDFDHLKRVILKEQPEIIIHMAAQSLVRRSYTHPVETYATNVMGTVNLFEAVRHAESVRIVVNVTSDKCYENNAPHPGYREEEPMGGKDPYSSSKGCAELVTSAYRQSFFADKGHPHRGVAVATARAGNVVGGGDWAEDRLVPDIVRAFMEERPVLIRNPHAIRPWQHVLEPLRGYLSLAERLWTQGSAFAEGWNFGPAEDDAKPVSWIVERLADLWGERARWELDSAQHPYEAGVLKLDCSKAKSLLSWYPVLGLPVALEWIIEWYRGYLNHLDMRLLTEEQIARYERLAAK
ncbi:CDP-glucose 4,6-dehydratase [Nitrospiraceae bacterium HYJII51-Mn-bac16s-1-B09]|uniref:CDP-glucose 4,6-dehydratase n=1 Tax=Candidatus Manganitrophus noduliformans TaxID=2606439 RepID=A0A7X6DS15_9BACT|nr:CDP-glucose 4,6-dehydratase [Candidatus Manganitrophus noduliformans]